MRKYFHIVFILLFGSTALGANFSMLEKSDTSKKTKLYVDKISASLNFVAGVPMDNYLPIGFNVRANYKVWRNFSVGMYSAMTFASDFGNTLEPTVKYISTNTFIHALASVGYQYYIFDKKLAFGLYVADGMYHRRIQSSLKETINNIDRTYKAKHTDNVVGIMYDMHFAINKKLAINLDVSVITNPYWGVDVYSGLGLIYRYGIRTYGPLLKRK